MRSNGTSKTLSQGRENLYHITSVDKFESIQVNGLKANNDGDIFLFENVAFRHPMTNQPVLVATAIAMNQLFLSEYVLFEVLPTGITCELETDNVGEFSARWQWIAKQGVVAPEFIRYVGRFAT